MSEPTPVLCLVEHDADLAGRALIGDAVSLGSLLEWVPTDA